MWSASDLEVVLSLNRASVHLVATANDSQMTGISYSFAKHPSFFQQQQQHHIYKLRLRYVVMKNVEMYLASSNFAFLI